MVVIAPKMRHTPMRSSQRFLMFKCTALRSGFRILRATF
jgi:hypothetical protein